MGQQAEGVDSQAWWDCTLPLSRLGQQPTGIGPLSAAPSPLAPFPCAPSPHLWNRCSYEAGKDLRTSLSCTGESQSSAAATVPVCVVKLRRVRGAGRRWRRSQTAVLAALVRTSQSQANRDSW